MFGSRGGAVLGHVILDVEAVMAAVGMMALIFPALCQRKLTMSREGISACPSGSKSQFS